jgi:hypothetical protein
VTATARVILTQCLDSAVRGRPDVLVRSRRRACARRRIVGLEAFSDCALAKRSLAPLSAGRCWTRCHGELVLCTWRCGFGLDAPVHVASSAARRNVRPVPLGPYLGFVANRRLDTSVLRTRRGWLRRRCGALLGRTRAAQEAGYMHLGGGKGWIVLGTWPYGRIDECGSLAPWLDVTVYTALPHPRSTRFGHAGASHAALLVSRPGHAMARSRSCLRLSTGGRCGFWWAAQCVHWTRLGSVAPGWIIERGCRYRPSTGSSLGRRTWRNRALCVCEEFVYDNCAYPLVGVCTSVSVIDGRQLRLSDWIGPRVLRCVRGCSWRFVLHGCYCRRYASFRGRAHMGPACAARAVPRLNRSNG